MFLDMNGFQRYLFETVIGQCDDRAYIPFATIKEEICLQYLSEPQRRQLDAVEKCVDDYLLYYQIVHFWRLGALYAMRHPDRIVKDENAVFAALDTMPEYHVFQKSAYTAIPPEREQDCFTQLAAFGEHAEPLTAWYQAYKRLCISEWPTFFLHGAQFIYRMLTTDVL